MINILDQYTQVSFETSDDKYKYTGVCNIKDNTINYINVTVYLDKCIDTPEIREFIEDRFNLYLSTCKVSYDGQLSVDGSHYVCHNCK